MENESKSETSLGILEVEKVLGFFITLLKVIIYTSQGVHIVWCWFCKLTEKLQTWNQFFSSQERIMLPHFAD